MYLLKTVASLDKLAGLHRHAINARPTKNRVALNHVVEKIPTKSFLYSPIDKISINVMPKQKLCTDKLRG
jgi:hypothetical protein